MAQDLTEVAKQVHRLTVDWEHGIGISMNRPRLYSGGGLCTI